MADLYQGFGKKVREYRKQRQYTNIDLAKRLNVSSGLISNIENGKNDVFKLDLLINLMKELDVSLEQLINLKTINIKQTLENFNDIVELDSSCGAITEEDIERINLQSNVLIKAFIGTILECGCTSEKIDIVGEHLIEQLNFIKKINK